VKNKPVESNCPSAATRKAAPAKQRKNSQPIQSRRIANKRPDDEDYWFDDWFTELKEAEYVPCFWYEIRRVRMNRHHASIMEQVAEIDNSGESEAEKFRQKLELQEELDEMKRDERPWPELTDVEKREFMDSIGSIQPVRLAKEVRPWERMGTEYASSAVEHIELSIDFRKGNEILMASFESLLKKMRKEGKSKFTKPGRPESIELKLFNLSVYRCLQRGMKPDEVWEHLAPLREKLWIGKCNRTRLPYLSEKIEREIGVLPS
jgi:hypothetical protein